MSLLQNSRHTGGDEPRPYGSLCRGQVYPLPFNAATGRDWVPARGSGGARRGPTSADACQVQTTSADILIAGLTPHRDLTQVQIAGGDGDLSLDLLHALHLEDHGVAPGRN